MDHATQERIAAIVGRPVVGAERSRGGGYTPAERWIVRLADGTSAFAKVGVSDTTRGWLRTEAQSYASILSPHMAACLGFHDHPTRPLLLLEDLSHARWPPPWEEGDVDRVKEALATLAATRPLPVLPALAATRKALLSGWRAVVRDPSPFLSLGFASRDWLEAALPRLRAAQEAAVVDGDDLLHFDVRSDNICLLPDRVVLVDWNTPRRGPAAFDLACWAPSLRTEGGPLPEELVPDGGAYASMIAGYFASQAGLEEIPDAPRVRWIQRRQLRMALPWAARALGLPVPDGDFDERATAAATIAVDMGAIDESEWFRRVEEVLVDGYLASEDPRAQSGKSGDESQWRWSRELVLDACGDRADILDVGCANGLLMESLHAWGHERGIAVEPYGLEISDRLARVARHRLPQWADRIAVGNVLTWDPPRRFDVVHTAFDYVPRKRRREMVERILSVFLRPGGRLVLRPERVGGSQEDPETALRDVGFTPGGAIESVHPTTGAIRRTAWIA